MGNTKNPKNQRLVRHARMRKRISGTPERPRLCVFRSLNQIYAQIIDDSFGHTLTSASTLEPEGKKQSDGKSKTEWSKVVGALIAQRAVKKGISLVVFDRGGYKYQGRIKALAEAAKEGGLVF